MMDRSRNRALLVAGVSLAAAIGAVLLSRLVFPLLSINNDEAILRLHADAIAHGELFPATLGLPDAFRPWLAAGSGDSFILKYPPVIPGFIAASQLLTGGPQLYLALVAAGTVVMSYLLAAEILGDRTEAVLACLIVAVSPLVIVQSGLLLSYLPTLLLLEVFIWSLIRGLPRRSAGLVALSGAALGVAAFIRPLDAVVFGVPILGWAILRHRAAVLSPRLVLAFLAPGAAVAAAFLAFNAAATGSALKPPFSLLESQDTLGFGTRRLYPTDPPHEFGLREGVTGLVRHGALLFVWVAGGVIVAALGLVTLLRRRAPDVAWALVASGCLLLAVYVFFWGPWNATVLWGGTSYVGPFYFLPTLLPLAVLGARGLVDLFRWRPAAGVAASVGIVGMAGVTMAVVVAGNLAFTRDNRALERLVSDRSAQELVFTTTPTPYLQHPSPVVSNNSDIDGDVVYAINLGDADLEAADLMPDRTPYLLQYAGEFRRADQEFWGRLDELRRVDGERVPLQVTALPASPGAGPLTLAVSAFGTRSEYAVGEGGVNTQELVLGPDGAILPGRTPDATGPAPDAAGLRLELVGPNGVVARQNIPARDAGSGVEVLAPTGRTWTEGPAPAPQLQTVLDAEAR